MMTLKRATLGTLLVSLGLLTATGVVAAAAPAAPLAATMTDPAPNARVPAPLPMVHVIFNGPVDPKASGFEITKSDGTRVDVQEVGRLRPERILRANRATGY